MAAISLRDLAAVFRTTLMAAQEERNKRHELVTIDGERESGWVFYERSVMHREINRVRADARLPDVPVEAVKRVELQATGHCDYTQKFAFYCAEIALGCSPIRKTEEN